MFPINDKLTKIDVAFPANVSHLMPKWHELPEEFQRERHPMCEIANRWFFSGLKGAKFKPRAGVDEDKALTHLRCIVGSFEPKHEHKIAAVGYLLNEWFESVEVGK